MAEIHNKACDHNDERDEIQPIWPIVLINNDHQPGTCSKDFTYEKEQAYGWYELNWWMSATKDVPNNRL